MREIGVYLRSLFTFASFIVTAMAVFFVFPMNAHCQDAEESRQKTLIPDEEWNDEIKIWLTRSVLGEAGWRRFNEYSAIAWVYKTRSDYGKKFDFLGMIKKYSAAVRPQGQKRQPWLFKLGLEGVRPEGWPRDKATGQGPVWKGRYKKAWLDALQWAEDWRQGKFENPCKGANHFGGPIDSHRARRAQWKKVRCSVRTRNIFYTSLVLEKQKPVWVGQGRSRVEWLRSHQR